MRFPFRAGKIFWERALDSGDAQDGFGVARRHSVPESPKIFERGVALAVEERMLQAVRFVARETIRDVDGVARLESFYFADHGYERIGHVFPGHPIVPTDIAPGE